jgi:hypothetical protein
MTTELRELLSLIRQHEGFADLLKAVTVPQDKSYRTSLDPEKQYADWIFNSGRQKQNELWNAFLTNSPQGEINPSDKEKL